MVKSELQSSLNELIEKNFTELSSYLDIKIRIFSELRPLLLEVCKCLILEFHQAAITLTNNILERLLKLALVYNLTGIEPIRLHDWNMVFIGPTSQYGTLTMFNSIVECLNCELITKSESDYLSGTIKALIRNGFSHADASKILANVPETATLVISKLNAPTEIEAVNLNQKQIPMTQAILINNFATENSESYFVYVMDLLLNIEKRLMIKHC